LNQREKPRSTVIHKRLPPQLVFDQYPLAKHRSEDGRHLHGLPISLLSYIKLLVRRQKRTKGIPRPRILSTTFFTEWFGVGKTAKGNTK